MRVPLCVCMALAAAIALPAAIRVGDTYQKVLKEKGRPSGMIEAGATVSLHYAGEVITLERGKVIAIDAAPVRPESATEALPLAAAAARSTAPRAAAAEATPSRSAPVEKASLRAVPVRGGLQPGRWTTDYTAAVTAAKEQNRRVFLLFTGSDWSSGCMQLKHEILSTPTFLRYASEHLMLVELDFPKRRKLPPLLKAQNDGLKREYGIHQFPIVVLLDSSGQQIGMLGYMEGGPEAFVAELKKL